MQREIVCLCGSTRFMIAYHDANHALTLKGYIVLTVGCNEKLNTTPKVTAVQKLELDELHLNKIRMSDVVYFLNVGGYMQDDEWKVTFFVFGGEREVTVEAPDAMTAVLKAGVSAEIHTADDYSTLEMLGVVRA